MMNKYSMNDSGTGEKITKWIYGVLLFVLVFSGFGQMPLYQRYYLTDLPGMKWAGNFYTTHYLHYIAVILFLGFVFYKTADYFLVLKQTLRVTTSGILRAVWIIGILLTGACLVINNFTGTRFSAGFIIFLDIAHIGFMMLLGITAVYCKIKKKKWMVAR